MHNPKLKFMKNYWHPLHTLYLRSDGLRYHMDIKANTKNQIIR